MQMPQNRYIADLREFRFLLFEQFKLQDFLGKGVFEAWGEDEVNMVLDESYKFSCEVLGPLNAVGDQEGCRLENGQVYAPTGFKDAWNKLYEAGWRAIGADPEFGGQGSPHVLQMIVEEFMTGANTAFNMYSALTYGALEVIQHFGTEKQKNTYLRSMLNGHWGGTMCLTEPQAGSDVGAAKSTASKLPNGKYSIHGTKIFISAGDHDLAENIIHMVLARVDGAPAGTKGLSLFIVPKYRFDDQGNNLGSNDVLTGSIEHKMGINGSSTCVLNFGENDQCEGELVGEVENLGMSQMFLMMNGARIVVGLQGLAVASSAYLNALAYAKDRKQGASIEAWKDPTVPRVSIIQHPDVRRMLLDMKSRVEGIRALALSLAMHQDMVRIHKGKDDLKTAYHQGQVDLLVPLVKAYGTDQAFHICETAIQTYGGAGYIKDYPVEQYCRDSKIFSIYEGTNHIQAMDLVGRKLGQNGGANLNAFLSDINQFISKNENHPILSASVNQLKLAHQAFASTAMRLLLWFQTGRVPMVPLFANRFLEMMSTVAVGWRLLEGATIAIDKLENGNPTESDKSFYEGKKYSAIYFATNVLSHVKSLGEIVALEDSSPLKISDDSFSTL